MHIQSYTVLIDIKDCLNLEICRNNYPGILKNQGILFSLNDGHLDITNTRQSKDVVEILCDYLGVNA